MGWDGVGWEGMGRHGMEWDGMGWDGMGRDGMGCVVAARRGVAGTACWACCSCGTWIARRSLNSINSATDENCASSCHVRDEAQAQNDYGGAGGWYGTRIVQHLAAMRYLLPTNCYMLLPECMLPATSCAQHAT